MKGARLVLCVLAALPLSAAGQDLGRLFLSPTERAALDAARLEPSRGNSAADAPQRVDGYVLRSGGRATVWVNGVSQPAAESAGAAVGQKRDRAAGPARSVLEGGETGVRR